MLGLCFRLYVRRSQGAGTDPAKCPEHAVSMPSEHDSRRHLVVFGL